MNKYNTLLLAVSLTMTAVSCSQLDEAQSISEETDVGHGQEVLLTFSINTGNMAGASQHSRGSRAAYDYSSVCFIPKAGDAYFDENPGKNFAPPRELDCENFWQQVNDVKIYTFKADDSGDFRYTGKSYTVTDFTNKFSTELGGGPTAIWCGGFDDDTHSQESYSYSTREDMAHGRYKFLAIARDDNEVDEQILTISGLTEGTKLEDVTATGSFNDNHHQTTEFFWKVAKDVAGNDLIYTIDHNTKVLTVNIGSINRAVAGLLCYVENIPATQTAADGKTYSVDYIGLSTAAFADKTTPALSLTDNKESYNATKPFSHHFGRMSLSGFSVEDGYYVRDTPYSMTHPNALLFGSFIIPQGNEAHSAQKDLENIKNTLYLVYYHKNDETGEAEPISWIPIKDGVSNSYSFPLQANHLYTLGTKRYTPDGHGFKIPEDHDKPVDLRVQDGNVDLVIHICPYYDQSHIIEIN